MNIRMIVAVTATVTAAATAAAAPVLAATRPSIRLASAGAPARPAIGGGTGWQGKYTYNVPAGESGLFFHYSCPSGMIALNGGYSASDKAGNLRIIGDHPWQELGYHLWAWNFKWPGGAPSGESIDFDVYCTAGPA